MASYRGDRVNPGDALDCSLYGDLRIAEEEPEEEPEEEFSSNHNLVFIEPEEEFSSNHNLVFITLLLTGSTVDIVVSTKESWWTYRQD